MLKIINPATEDLIREVPSDSHESVAKKFSRAEAAQPAWASTPLEERREILHRFKNLLVEKKDELAVSLTAETGKPLRQSLNELSAAPERVEFFLDNFEAAMSSEAVFRYPTDPTQPLRLEESVTYEPLGVVGVISAWNYPYFMGVNVFVPALLVGNTVLHKVSEYATITGLIIADMLHSCGVPKDAFVIVVGGSDVGLDLLRNPLGGLFYAGDYRTGVQVAEAAARRMTRAQFELGGKDSAYVCEDVDVPSIAAAVADGAFYNAGQTSCSVERVYVQRRVYDSFLEALLEIVRGFTIGDPMLPGTFIGPLTDPERLNVLSQQVEDAVAKGARVLCGGKRYGERGFFFEPTILVDVGHHMAVMREPSSGPIVAVMAVDSDDEAVRLMNDSDYGLTAAVFTQDLARAERLLGGQNVATVYWNCCDRMSARLPWSGRKHSGIGSILSVSGIRAFMQAKAWHLQSSV